MNLLEATTFITVGATAGLVGGLLGLGGGVILVPALTLFCDVPVKTAIAASAFVVLVNAHLVGLQKNRLASVNFSSAIILQLVALVFSLIGAWVSVQIDPNILEQFFGIAAVTIAILMIVVHSRKATSTKVVTHVVDSLQMPQHPFMLSFFASFAGILAGALGVGGGIFLVPAMQFIGRLPVRVATATSSYTMAVTGTGAALVYLSSPFMRPALTVLCLAGALVGGNFGNKLAHKVDGRIVNFIFAGVLLVVGFRMWL